MDAYDYLDQHVLVSLHLRALQLRGLEHVFHPSTDEYQYHDINTIFKCKTDSLPPARVRTHYHGKAPVLWEPFLSL
jgi:hypothetical protein